MLIISTKITGLDEKIQQMKNIQLDLQDFQIGEIINYVCSLVARDAISAASTFKRTGTLMNSIVYYMNNELSGEVAALAPYAYPVEYGYTARNGKRIQGRNFFRPAAIRGAKLLRDELLKYTIEVVKGTKTAKVPTASRGSGRGSANAHKYLYKVQTGAGVRYVYGKKSQTRTSFRPLLLPSGRKQAGPSFKAYRGGARKRSR